MIPFLLNAVKFNSILWRFAIGGDLHFPPDFKFGSATAAYQVEGAWNASGRGVSIWDYYAHSVPGAIGDGSTGDVACDSYHKWERDIKVISELGLNFYRFSISWVRLLPSGFPTHISEDGKNYYNNLIDGLLAKGIEPVVTIYHWDLPQRFQVLGGWANDLISDWYADYARIVFSLFADRVKTWVTINEPMLICDEPHNSGMFAPGIVDPDLTSYLCTKNVLLAHAKAWRIFDKEYRPKYHGKLALSNHLIWFMPESEKDVNLTELVDEYSTGRFSHAIYSKEGGWPPRLKKIIEENSRKQGYRRSRLPPFTQNEIDLIKGTYDYYGINYYTARYVRMAKPGEELGPWFVGDVPELKAKLIVPPEWETGVAELAPIYPEGLRHICNRVKKLYGDVDILITENGFSDLGHNLKDDKRIKFIRDHLEQVLLAIQDGVKVRGYTYWSLIDNFEWMAGFRLKYGLYEVDFEDPERRRVPRKSAFYFKNVIRNRSLDVSVNPEEFTSKPNIGIILRPSTLNIFLFIFFINFDQFGYFIS